MFARVLRPHPRHPALNGFIEGICLCWKTWFRHLSPARHTSGWHSYIKNRLIQPDCGPHGASSSAWQLHCGISSSKARRISTLPIGTFAYTEQQSLVYTRTKLFRLLSDPIHTKNLMHSWNRNELQYTVCMEYLACLDMFVCWWFSVIKWLFLAVCTKWHPLPPSNCGLSHSWNNT